MILFVKNISVEGPGTLGTFFQKKGYQTQEIDLQAGDRLPSSWDNLDAVVILGGPMNVYEEEKYPFLKDEDIFIKEALKKKIPYMGLCLGAQLLAKACGARVVRSPKEEIGFSTVQFTKAAEADGLFKGMGKEIDVFQWHGDMFHIPSGGELLAASKDCPHQAFRVGTCAWGIQFHVEVTDKSIQEWIEAYFNMADPAQAAQKKKMLEDYRKKKDQFHRVADKIYENFLRTITQKNAKINAKQR